MKSPRLTFTPRTKLNQELENLQIFSGRQQLEMSDWIKT